MKRITEILLPPLLVIALLCGLLVQPVLSIDETLLENRASAELLRRHVDTLVLQMPPRSHNADSLKKSADYIHKTFSQYHKARVSYQPFDVWGIGYHNVMASFGPEEGKRFVIGAHYDSHDGLPGADDNASGVAGLLELARLLNGKELARRVDLVAYALEEMPSFRTPDMGSAHHVERLKEEGVEVELMISLEMIGYFDDTPGSQLYPAPLLEHLYPDTGNFIAVVGNLAQIPEVRRVKRAMQSAAKLPVYSINAPVIIPGIDFSDHLNFWRAGYPAVMITDTADSRNKAYHTEQDTPESLDYVRMAEVVNGVFGVVISE
ncbi:MAG: M28 family peptidase [Chromatiales bacterium]|nr:M28 family peptidase [Chromatiales bacterium]